MTTITTSAPAKVILLGEHGVNRGQPALATALEVRVRCRVAARSDDRYALRSDDRSEIVDYGDLRVYKAEVDQLRRRDALDELRARTRDDFFAPARYVLAHVAERVNLPGLAAAWESSLPIGSGLGSGAAATTSLALAAMSIAGHTPEPRDLAFLAWQGDVIAHGGVASGLDSGTIALGGVTRYTLEDGSQPLACRAPLPLVIGDSGVRADTAEVNTRVRVGLSHHPARAHLFAEMGLLVRHALEAIAVGDLDALGQLMNLNQLLLEKLGVSSSELDRLIEASHGAGALGAKLSGSGGGGIIVALVSPGREGKVAAAIDAAGGRSIIASAGAPGARIEPAGARTLAAASRS